MSALKEFAMRYYPAAMALSLVVAATASMGQGKAPEPVDPRATALLDAGKEALAANNPPAAIDAFEAALAVSPGLVPAYLALAEAARREGLQGKAIHYYRQALARDPTNLAAIAGEGGAMAEKGALEKARRNLAKLERMCGTGCQETQALALVISRGPQVRSAQAAPTTAPVSQN